MHYRYNFDKDLGTDHIAKHQISREEVEYVIENPVEDGPAWDNARQAIGKTSAGRYLRVIYVPDSAAEGIYVVTAFDLEGKPLEEHLRRTKNQ